MLIHTFLVWCFKHWTLFLLPTYTCTWKWKKKIGLFFLNLDYIMFMLLLQEEISWIQRALLNENIHVGAEYLNCVFSTINADSKSYICLFLFMVFFKYYLKKKKMNKKYLISICSKYREKIRIVYHGLNLYCKSSSVLHICTGYMY